ncbi:MAG TPA: SRPBCC domain-containing protein, partial [Nitrospirota bacterium]
IVATFEFEGAPGHVSLETLTLEEGGGMTLLTNRSVFQTKADRDAMLQAGMKEGASETMDRLGELIMHAGVERKAA